MSSDKNIDPGLDDLYQDYWAIHSQKLDEHDPLEVAAVLLAQAMTIYRTVLDNDNYNKIVDDISRLRNEVTILVPEDRHYH